jgi:hypothetical protein
MRSENIRDSDLCLLSSDDYLVKNHPSRRVTHTLTGWHRYGVAPKAAAVRRRWLNLRKTPSEHSRLAVNGLRRSYSLFSVAACHRRSCCCPAMSVGFTFHGRELY